MYIVDGSRQLEKNCRFLGFVIYFIICEKINVLHTQTVLTGTGCRNVPEVDSLQGYVKRSFVFGKKLIG